jgi:predicted metalloendopeptidase
LEKGRISAQQHALARLHAMGVPAMFDFGARPDLHDASREVAVMVQGGLGLPDREYYLSQSEESKRTQARYVAHIAAMLKLLGDAPELAEKEAGAVLEVERSWLRRLWIPVACAPENLI